ncbi:hypothetical protein SC1083_0889 [Aggregatibacter actinomycetemcomitans serotype e str. SC1083]|uniref:Uncharacterized protein n=1 Tax=Aggregatibacter actinomycetemcomitans serotype e str. SC1083 TaxID=907488 RepID=G4A7U3_AGGAC|nr:hypothetical protein SC1083_0889 [Aggregatibacter actinomycetemcomitans serotype e str. SC1083]
MFTPNGAVGKANVQKTLFFVTALLGAGNAPAFPFNHFHKP